jgi:cyclase
MLKARIIPVLLLRNGRMVKGRQFQDFRDVGDPVSAARIYNAQNADELVILDIDATDQGRGALLNVISRISEECFMPLTVGGGIRSSENIRSLLNAGADKVVITTAALDRPELIAEAAHAFGNQCIVVGMDVRKEPSQQYVLYSNSGKQKREKPFLEHLHAVETLGAGEVLVNSIDRDGMMGGYDLDLARLVQLNTALPVIIAGGAGNFQHLLDAMTAAKLRAVACASLFHFADNNPIRARAFLRNAGIPMKNTK